MKPHHGNIEILNSDENLKLLEAGLTAHLGCYDKGEIYIVPITYFYKDGYIYSHSKPGKKIQMMRNNPKICIQVEQVEDFFNWKSVISWGRYEELKDEDAVLAMRSILKNMGKNHQENLPTDFELDVTAVLMTSIVFRMKVSKTTGRFEDEDDDIDEMLRVKTTESEDTNRISE